MTLVKYCTTLLILLLPTKLLDISSLGPAEERTRCILDGGAGNWRCDAQRVDVLLIAVRDVCKVGEGSTQVSVECLITEARESVDDRREEPSSR